MPSSSTSIAEATARIRARRDADARGAIALVLLRLGLVGLGAVVTTLTLHGIGIAAAFPPSPVYSTLALLPINVVCLALVLRLLHRRGQRARDLIGYRPGRLGADILWGFLWLTVLYIPFAATIMGVMAVLHGGELLSQFEAVFVGADPGPAVAPTAALVLGVLTVVTFAPLNAPTEELVYRGLAQRALLGRLPTPLAIALPALAFGLQHVFYAPTPDAVLVYGAAFFVWGLGSGLIYLRQGRLLPLIVAHGVVNLIANLPALVFPLFL